MLRKLLAAACFALCMASPAHAAGSSWARVILTCGSPPTSTPYNSGNLGEITMDTTGTLCTAGGSSSSYTVNYGAAIGTKGTPGGFKDNSGNFQPLIGNTAALGPYVDTSPSSQLAAYLKASVPCTAGSTSTTQSAVSSGAQTTVQCDLNGNLYVNAAITQLPAATPSGIVAANSTNSTNLKASAGTVYGVQTSNINASNPYYLKLYDKATAPTCGTDTPVARFVIPPNFSGNNGVFPVGKKFLNGIGFCITGGIADNDTTVVPAATVLSNIDWN